MKTKEMIICLITLIVLGLTVSSVHATGGVNDLNELLGNNTGNEIETNVNELEDIPTTNNIVNENQNEIEIPTNNNVEDLPDTGVDYSIIILISVCAVSSLYAYKKIKDYTIR